MATQLEDTALAVKEPEQLTAKEVRAQVNLVQDVMKAVMQNGTHYGKIPGCGDKPTLLKPGAEKLASTFRLAISPEVEDMSTKDAIRYRIRAMISHQVSGAFLGAGVGECSSNEEKYCWRNAVCQEEYADTPEDRRRIKYKSSYGKVQKVNQVRTNPADLANTVLKMAKKRALVDGILTVCGASDIFTQDIEDMPEELLHADKPKAQQPIQAPVQATQPEGPEPVCGKCGGPLKYIPDGIAKSGKNAGKPYTAFWICSNDKWSIKDSEWKKVATASVPEPMPEYSDGSDPDPFMEREPGMEG